MKTLVLEIETPNRPQPRYLAVLLLEGSKSESLLKDLQEFSDHGIPSKLKVHEV